MACYVSYVSCHSKQTIIDYTNLLVNEKASKVDYSIRIIVPTCTLYTPHTPHITHRHPQHPPPTHTHLVHASMHHARCTSESSNLTLN